MLIFLCIKSMNLVEVMPQPLQDILHLMLGLIKIRRLRFRYCLQSLRHKDA